MAFARSARDLRWAGFVRRCTSIRAGFKTTEGSNNASSSARAIENHADCLAGVWAHSYYRKGRLDRRAILEGMNIAYRIGDKQPNDEKNWGTPEERVRWFLTGYTSGDFYECSGALR
jgi:predicted metalloprotease